MNKIFHLTISGFCLGFLAGLSMSPVAHILIAFFISIILGLNILHPFVKNDNNFEKNNPLLISLISIFITVGVIVGVIVRANEYLSFKNLYHTNQIRNSKDQPDSTNEKSIGIGLNSGRINNIKELQSAIRINEIGEIKKALFNTGDSLVVDFTESCTDTIMLKKFADYVNSNNH